MFLQYQFIISQKLYRILLNHYLSGLSTWQFTDVVFEGCFSFSCMKEAELKRAPRAVKIYVEQNVLFLVVIVVCAVDSNHPRLMLVYRAVLLLFWTQYLDNREW